MSDKILFFPVYASGEPKETKQHRRKSLANRIIHKVSCHGYTTLTVELFSVPHMTQFPKTHPLLQYSSPPSLATLISEIYMCLCVFFSLLFIEKPFSSTERKKDKLGKDLLPLQIRDSIQRYASPFFKRGVSCLFV